MQAPASGQGLSETAAAQPQSWRSSLTLVWCESNQAWELRSDQPLRCRSINTRYRGQWTMVFNSQSCVHNEPSIRDSGHSSPLRRTMVLYFVRILSFRIFQKTRFLTSFHFIIVMSLDSSPLCCTVLAFKHLSPSEEVYVKDAISSVPSLLEIRQV